MTVNNNRPSWEHDRLVHGWWVVPGRLLATEYPGAKDQAQALLKLQGLSDAGVNSFVDLTEPGERTWDGSPMVPYSGLLAPDVTYKPARWCWSIAGAARAGRERWWAPGSSSSRAWATRR